MRVELEELVTGAEIARRLKVSRQRVYAMRHNPGFPEPIGRIGKALVWRWSDVERWNRERRAAASGGPGKPGRLEDLAGAWRDRPELGREIREDREE